MDEVTQFITHGPLARGSLFRDRLDAGEQLARRLERYRGTGVLVLGIPRGGVPVAAVVARQLDAELDVLLARKLGAPDQPELALGAVTANGGLFLNRAICGELEVSGSFLAAVTREQREEAERRERRFRGDRPAARVRGRTVILVDDRLATGATMRAAARSVRKRKPARLIVAFPVGPRQACAELLEDVDELVCLYQPDPFWAVGLHYTHFEQTEDDEVRRLLAGAHPRPQTTSGP